jgi:Flp pilus assembly protein TadB
MVMPANRQPKSVPFCFIVRFFLCIDLTRMIPRTAKKNKKKVNGQACGLSVGFQREHSLLAVLVVTLILLIALVLVVTLVVVLVAVVLLVLVVALVVFTVVQHKDTSFRTCCVQEVLWPES